MSGVANSVEQAIVGVFLSVAVTMTLVVHGPIGKVLAARPELRTIAGAVALTIIVWLGYLCVTVYQLLWELRGGYQSKRRPCLSDIASAFRAAHGRDPRAREIPQKRLEMLSYYAWAYAQEQSGTTLSNTLIERIARGWRRVHFAGANLVGVMLGIGVLCIDCCVTSSPPIQTSDQIVLGIYAPISILLFVRWRQERKVVHRLERFVVLDNWSYLDAFLLRCLRYPVETLGGR